MRTYAQLTTSFVVFCNRVGVDESIIVLGRLRGHRSRTARRSSAPRSTTRACSPSTSTRATSDANGSALPLLRDERPELQVRELARIVAERAGFTPDSTAEPGAEPGLDVGPGERRARPIGFGSDGERPAAREPGKAAER